MGEFAKAQICIAGHVISSTIDRNPELSSKRCSICGEETITRCQECGTEIRGLYFPRKRSVSLIYNPPDYCHECGKPYPWTTAKIRRVEAAVIDELQFDPELQSEAVSVLPDLFHKTSKTDLAINVFSKVMTVVGTEAKNYFIEVFKESVCEEVAEFFGRLEQLH